MVFKLSLYIQISVHITTNPIICTTEQPERVSETTVEGS